MASRSPQADPSKRKPGAPLTDAEKARIRELVAQNATHASICRELGIGSSTLSRFKKQEGLTTVPGPGAEAAALASSAYKRDAAAKRAERTRLLDELFADRAEYLRKVQRGEVKYKTLVKIPGGGEITEQLSYIPAQDWRSEVSALGTLGTSIDRADDRADDGGLARAQSMLQAVLAGIQGRPIEVPAEQGSFEE